MLYSILEVVVLLPEIEMLLKFRTCNLSSHIPNELSRWRSNKTDLEDEDRCPRRF